MKGKRLISGIEYESANEKYEKLELLFMAIEID